MSARAEEIAASVRLLRAPNPGPMTGAGTNSYLVGRREVVVIDPGPDHAGHRARLLAAATEAGGRVVAILITHAHADHSEGAPALAAATGATVLGFGRFGAGARPAHVALARASAASGGGEGGDLGFTPDETLADGAVAARADGLALVALHTPGHVSEHLCFLREDGVAFTGDHAMGWSTSLVSPPEGDMRAYVESLERLAAADARLWAPGHGAPVADPAARGAELLAHRRARHARVAAALGPEPRGLEAITREAYADTPQAPLAAAARNALAHLLALIEEGRAALASPAADGAPRFGAVG